ncbi:MAG: DPP IV N-terminal domain-containing protein [Pelobium sp.]
MNKYIITASALLFFYYGNAQQKQALSTKDYEHAESFLGYNTSSLIDGGSVRPNWLTEDRFWYQESKPDGTTFIIVNPSKKTKKVAFDHQKIATALTKITGKSYEANQLPIERVVFDNDENAIRFSLGRTDYHYNFKTDKIEKEDNHAPVSTLRRSSTAVLSPNGKLEAFIKNDNLWVKDIETNKETPLTTDGVKDFGYATDNAGWTHGDGAILRWSPDSKKIATFKQDQRNVSEMYLVTTNVGAPKLQQWKYPFVGDKRHPNDSQGNY